MMPLLLTCSGECLLFASCITVYLLISIGSTKTRLDHAAREIKLPDTTNIDTHNKFVPPLLVVQIQIPSDPPPMFGSVEDGPGWAILMYFKITEVQQLYIYLIQVLITIINRIHVTNLLI